MRVLLVLLLLIGGGGGTALWGAMNSEGTEKAAGASGKNLAPYRIVIDRDQLRLFLYQGDKLVKSYLVSVGSEKIGKPTPAGRFKIISKIKNPVMYWLDGTRIPAGDWRNPFGPRWLGLGDYRNGTYRGYGIHGTNSPDWIGKKISAGCIRMYSSDVLELFELVGVGTEVVIR